MTEEAKKIFAERPFAYYRDGLLDVFRENGGYLIEFDSEDESRKKHWTITAEQVASAEAYALEEVGDDLYGNATLDEVLINCGVLEWLQFFPELWAQIEEEV